MYAYTPRASTSYEGYGRGRDGNGGQRRRGMRESTREKKPITIMGYQCPRDQEGIPVPVPMRFEVIKRDGSNATDTEDLKKYFRDAFNEAALNCSVRVKIDEVRVTPVDGMCHSRWVYHLELSCDDWQSSLTLLASQFLNSIRNDPVWITVPDEMPVLYTHSMLIYPLRLVNTHQDIPFGRIKFGSFINSGTIGVHWDIEGGIATEEDEKAGFNFYKDIDASFEYDRRQITIFFHNREANPEDENNEYFLATYKLTINMSSIRKIGLDQMQDKYGPLRRSLILHIDYAPKIQVKLRNVRNDGKERSQRHQPSRTPMSGGSNGQNSKYESGWSPFTHRLHIRRGRYPGEISSSSALHESKILVLEFDHHFIADKLNPPSSSIDQLCFDILSRLRHKTGKAVEFTSYDQVELLEGKIWEYDDYEGKWNLERVTPYDVDPFDNHVQDLIHDAARRMVLKQSHSPHIGDKFQQRHRIQLKDKIKKFVQAFRIRALLEGILQRGMEIRIQMLVNRNHWYTFVNVVCSCYTSHEQKTLAVMEDLLSIISEGRPHCTVMALFYKEWKNNSRLQRLTVFTEDEKKKGFTRIMKFVKTPSRLLFVGYETIMTNRVLHQNSNNGTEIVRISFRDDSGEMMREMSCGERILHDTMRSVLMEEGIIFAGRRYVWLGNSNSQLRDHGAYLFHESDIKTAREIRRKLGHFHKLTSIPKWLARQGQCFTQAKASENTMTADQVGMTCDYLGGMTDKGKPYCFSDGVGTISFELAKELSDEHSLPRIASAFQIRHKGQKGLVAVNPDIDDRNELLEMMGNKDMIKKIFVRPSMDKFEVEETTRGGHAQSDMTKLEIVKYSMASPLFLNRPLLNILSQVSEDQSPECHSRMMNRIEELLYIQLRNVFHSLYIEQRARDTIKEMSFPFAMEIFSDANPLKLTSEPFFRSLLRANARFVLQKQLAKMQIRIPSDFGRSMFGVVDDTGLLQYGQIFCQYSTSTSKHMGKSRSKRRDKAEGAFILTGPVMMTKNPCIEKGDVRRFEAVDVPGLRHLVDVVVFPMHGHRPHPDEMAGSDLDGDEYSLIWDSEMLFDHNEEASLFPSGEDVINWPIEMREDGTVDVEKCEKRLAEFYIEAVTQEQIGVLSNAHLATSDFYGLENKAARSLARKISQSLDFQKNGVAPEPMTKQPTKDEDNPGQMIPPERAARKPDYMEKMRDAGYESRGIMGKIYREIKRYQQAIDVVDDDINIIVKDEAFDLPDRTKYERTITRELETYQHGIRGLMEHYGISSEGEIMSGSIVSIKNRISEKEADDMNLFNTNMVIEDKVKREITAAREAFFSTIIDWRTELEPVEDKRRDVDRESILCHVLRTTIAPEKVHNLRLKAAAAYNICYDAANRQLHNGEQASIILSFPWIFYDVLADIKLRPDERIVRVLSEEEKEEKEQSNEPLAIILSEFIDNYCDEETNVGRFQIFKGQFGLYPIIDQSMKENEGLARASFVLYEWGKHIGGMRNNDRFDETHLVGLFIQFGLGEVMIRGTRRRYIQRPSGEIRHHLKKGEHLLKFIDYLSSRDFRTRSTLSFGDIIPCVLMRGEWKNFAELTIPAYLSLVTTYQLMEKEAETETRRSAALLKEFEPRKMELPFDVIHSKIEVVRGYLIIATSCEDVQLRQMGKTSEVFVSAIGTSENFKRLNDLVISPAPPRDQSSDVNAHEGIPNLVYQRLLIAAAVAAEL